MSAWFSRVYREYEAGNLTPLWRDVLRALGRFDACRFGIFPSHQFLARRARCSVRTVQRALEAARSLGLVSLDRTAREGLLAASASQQSVCPKDAHGAGAARSARPERHYRTGWPRSHTTKRKTGSGTAEWRP